MLELLGILGEVECSRMTTCMMFNELIVVCYNLSYNLYCCCCGGFVVFDGTFCYSVCKCCYEYNTCFRKTDVFVNGNSLP